MSIFQEFLTRVRDATQQNRLKWRKNSDGDFVATGGISLVIRQIVPLIAGPTETIGPQGFEVQTANVNFTVWDGTDCCDVIRDILATAFPEWAQQRKHIADCLLNAIEAL